jgi:ADP-ribose pyrophosphatase
LERQISTELLYTGKVVSLRVDKVETETGRISSREIVERADTVSILAIDEDGKVLLVRQYRYAAGTYSLEIPAGSIDPGETAEQAARRELREETGYACDSLEKLYTYYAAMGYSNEKMTVFLARGLRFSPLVGDEDDIRLERVSFQDLHDDVLMGRSPFLDAKSTIAVLLAQDRIKL